MHVTYDHQANAAYLSLVDIGPGEDVKQEVTKTGLILHFNNNGQLIGIETLKPTAHFPSELLVRASQQDEHTLSRA